MHKIKTIIASTILICCGMGAIKVSIKYNTNQKITNARSK